MRKIIFVLFLIICNMSCSENEKNSDKRQVLLKEYELTENSSLNLEIKQLQESLEVTKDFSEKAELCTKISKFYAQKGDILLTIKYASESVKYLPNQYYSHYLLGKSYILIHRYMDAKNELLLSIKLKPDYAFSHFELGNVFYKLKKYQNAIEEYKLAVSLNNNFYNAYNNLAVLYASLGKYKQSEKVLLQLIDLDPKSAVVYKNLGVLYDVKLKQKTNALKNYKKYLELKPNCPEKKLLKIWIDKLESEK